MRGKTEHPGTQRDNSGVINTASTTHNCDFVNRHFQGEFITSSLFICCWPGTDVTHCVCVQTSPWWDRKLSSINHFTQTGQSLSCSNLKYTVIGFH